MDDASDAGTTNAEYNLPQNPYAPQVEKALSSFDHRNRFVANAVYDLAVWENIERPRGAGRFANWRASGIF